MFAIRVAGDELNTFGIVGTTGAFGAGDLLMKDVTFVVDNERQILPVPIELSSNLSLPYQISNIRHVWSIICSKSRVDQNSGCVSLDTIIEAINGNIPNEFKGKDVILGLPIDIEIVTQWARFNQNEKCDAHARVSIQSKDYCQYLVNYYINLVQHHTFSQRLPIKGLGVKGSGAYQIVTEMRLSNSNIWYVVGVSSILIKLD